jgi:hypothetical protein
MTIISHISIGYVCECVSRPSYEPLSRFAARDVRLSRLPGWEKNSWGYHGDDGYSFAAEKNGTPYGPTYGSKSVTVHRQIVMTHHMSSSLAGDVIGCGIDFTQHKVFYTKNGTFLGKSSLSLLSLA